MKPQPSAATSVGPKNSPPSAENGENREATRDEAALILRRVFALLCASYNREPYGETELRVKIAAWRLALEDVPSDQWLGLAKAAIQNPASEFLPTTADLIRLWKKQQALEATPEGAANSDAYRLYENHNPPTLPEAPPALSITPDELKAKLRGAPSPESDAKRAEPKITEIEATPVTFSHTEHAATLATIIEQLNIEIEGCSAEQTAQLRAFAAWWLKTHPLREFTRADFERAWPQFLERPRIEK